MTNEETTIRQNFDKVSQAQFMYESDVVKKDRLTLERVLELMGNNLGRKAVYLIPDLQREYVWSSKKIINLIDTLVKGWPFGQILLANTGKMSPMFSPRTFFSKVVLFGDERGETMEAETYDDGATLVLDGQQRLQSLFLGLAPSSAGLVQDQRAWISEYSSGNEYYKRSGYKAPPAFLALNLENLCMAYEENRNVSRLDCSAQAKSPIIEWVFKNGDNAVKLWERRACLPKILKCPWGEDNTDKYVLLKDIWSANSIEELEQKHHIVEDAKLAFGAFCARFRELKNIPVPYLRILPQEQCGMNENEYNEMILSIFTRLNAGGEPLTEEEITYSWIKRYWPNQDIKAEDALNGLKGKLADKGIELKSSSLIRHLSNVWSVLEHDGEKLTVADMLDGELLKKVSAFLGDNWNTIAGQFVDVAAKLEKHNLCYGAQYYSLQGFELLVAWSIVGKVWHTRHSSANVAEQLKFNSLFSEMEKRLDRFVFASQWSNTLGDYLVELSKLQAEILKTNVLENASSAMLEWLEEHLNAYVKQAKVYVNDLNKTSPAGVSAYTTQLWCWQRLTQTRKEVSEVLSKEQDGITVGHPNVDHCVSVAFWTDYLKWFAEEYPKGSDVYNDMLARINQIGNCNILCKPINCSKNSQMMSEFWQKIGFPISDAEALNIPEEMFRPDKEEFRPDQIMRKIEERTQLIRKELCYFLDGTNNLYIHR